MREHPEAGRSRDKMRRYSIFATNVVSFFFFLLYNYLFYFHDPVFHLLKKPWLRTTQFLFQNLKAIVPVHIHPLFYSFIFSCVEPRHDDHQLANLLWKNTLKSSNMLLAVRCTMHCSVSLNVGIRWYILSYSKPHLTLKLN